LAKITSNLGITLLEDGEANFTWGDIVNDEVITLLEEAATKVTDIDISSVASPYTLDNTARITNEARATAIELSGVRNTDLTINFPATNRIYLVNALYSGTGTVTLTSGTDSTTLVAGQTVILFTEGTDVTAGPKTPVVFDAIVPIGGVAYWSGDVVDIPAGWQLCDGSLISSGPLTGNNTPNLADQFVIGGHNDLAGEPASDIEGADATTGGLVTQTSDVNVRSGLTTELTALTILQIPDHGHSYLRVQVDTDWNLNENSDPSNNDRTWSTLTLQTSIVGGDEGHDHDLSNVPDHDHTIDTISPYFALAYIMKIEDIFV